jgi:hypothetical protein
MRTFFKTRCSAIILIAAAYGWAGGHYIPSNSNIFAYLFQFIILAFVLLSGISFLGNIESKSSNRNWAVKGLSVFSVISFLLNILNMVHGAINKDMHSFGSHNTFADLVPIVILLIGSGLWIITILPFKQTLK